MQPIMFLCFLIMAIPLVYAAEQCPKGYIEVGSQCFMMSNTKMNWNQAKYVCESLSAQLASVKKPMELRDHINKYYSTKSFWLGGRYYREPDHNWKWVSGAPLDSSFPWGINDNGDQQPSGDKQHCMTLKFFPLQKEHEYVNNKCKLKKYYICEKPTIKLGSTTTTTSTPVTTTTTIPDSTTARTSTTEPTTTTTPDITTSRTSTIAPTTTTIPGTTLSSNLNWLTIGSDRFVRFDGSNWSDSGISWDDARDLCIGNGLDLYKPKDVIAVAKYLDDNFNGFYSSYYWYGARGNGTHMVLLSSSQVMASEDPWYHTNYYNSVATNDCLYFLAFNSRAEEGRVLSTSSCDYSSRYFGVICG